MKIPIRYLAALCLALGAVTGSAQILYDNGPLNGTVNAWQINHGSIISNSLTCCRVDTGSPNGEMEVVAGFDFYVWALPGDKPLTVDWSITSGENGGTVFGFGTANLTSQFVTTNAFGFDIDRETASGLDITVSVSSGTQYWLNLQNATTQQDNPLYWDENSGVGCMSKGCPSQASSNEVGTIPSESFDVFGPGGNGTTPEPGSGMLFASGILVLAETWRRKLKF